MRAAAPAASSISTTSETCGWLPGTSHASMIARWSSFGTRSRAVLPAIRRGVSSASSAGISVNSPVGAMAAARLSG